MYKKTNAANVKECINNTPMPQRHRLSQIYKIIQIALPVFVFFIYISWYLPV